MNMIPDLSLKYYHVVAEEHLIAEVITVLNMKGVEAQFSC